MNEFPLNVRCKADNVGWSKFFKIRRNTMEIYLKKYVDRSVRGYYDTTCNIQMRLSN